MKFLALLALFSTPGNCSYEDDITLLGPGKFGPVDESSKRMINALKTEAVNSL